MLNNSSDYFKRYATSKAHQKGLSTEKAFLDAMVALGFAPTPSDSYEDRELDIDCYIGSSSISIKGATSALDYGDVTFELTTAKSREDEPKESWHYTGQADYYAFFIGSQGVGEYFLVFSRQELHDYIREHGWEKNRFTSKKTQKTQQLIGHPHVVTFLGLLSIPTLHGLSTAKVIPLASKPHLSS